MLKTVNKDFTERKYMSGKFFDVVYAVVLKFRWKYIVLLLTGFFLASWSGIWYFERTNEMVKPSVFWWYFVTDVVRSGYSGYSPATFGGRIVSFACTIGGGVCFAAAVAKSLTYIYENTRKKTKGLVKINMKNHTVILGYRAGETEELIHQLTVDSLFDTEIALCTRKLTENPFNGKVQFFAGDTSSDDVLEKACVKDARVIVVCGHETDARTTCIAIAANDKAKGKVRIIAHFESLAEARFLRMAVPKAQPVTSLRPLLLAQEVLNPGSTRLVHELVSIDTPGTNFRINIPEGVNPVPFHFVLSSLNRAYGIVVMAYAESHEADALMHLNPLPDSEVKGGMSLFYLAKHPIDRIIDWSTIAPLTEDELCPVEV